MGEERKGECTLTRVDLLPTYRWVLQVPDVQTKNEGRSEKPPQEAAVCIKVSARLIGYPSGRSPRVARLVTSVSQRAHPLARTVCPLQLGRSLVALAGRLMVKHFPEVRVH